MSQRYFLTAESTYEDLRQGLNVLLQYPNTLGKSVFQTALYAPRDNFRRVLLAVDTALPGYDTVNASLQPLLDSDAMEEVDEATYLAALDSATAGASSWSDITGKPTFAAVATSGSASDLSTGTLNASRLPASVVRTGTYTDGIVNVDAISCVPTPIPEQPGDVQLWYGSDGVDMTSAIYADGQIICGAIRINGVDLDTTLSGKAAASHAHGSITNSGAIGTTSGLIVTTGASGVLGTLAMGTAGQVLKINSGASGVEWGTLAADVSIDATAADVLSAASGSITADDPGADRIVFWDDSASKLTHLTVGTGLSISGTTMTAAVTPTVASPSQITSNQNDYAGATADINRITSDAARDITGIAAGTDGQAILLVNVGSFTITLKHQSASSTAANRIIVPWGNDYAIPADGSATLVYDNTTARWRVL